MGTFFWYYSKKYNDHSLNIKYVLSEQGGFDNEKQTI